MSAAESGSPPPNVHGYPAPAFDLTLVFAAIEHHLYARPVRIEQRATKRPRYVFEAAMPDGSSAIIKIEHETDGDDAIVLEAWATEQAHAAGVLAPHVLALDTSEQILPGRYAIFSRVPGRPMADPASHYPLALMQPDERRLLVDAGRALRPLHEIAIEGYGRLDEDRYLRDGVVRGTHARWRDATLIPAIEALPLLRRAGVISEAEERSLRNVLAAHEDAFEDTPARLLHGDFDTTHIFGDGDPPHVTGIIDFGDREGGDPAWDLATFAVWEDDARLDALVEGYAPDAAGAANIARVVPVYVLARLLRLAAKRCAAGRTADATPLIERMRERYLH